MKIILSLVILLIFPSFVAAQFNDIDGILGVSWGAPVTGNPLDHYIWTYTINNVQDSITGTSLSNVTVDSSATLASIGHWAVFYIKAVSIVNDTSVAAVSDTAYYNLGTGIGPPTGVTWNQGP